MLQTPAELIERQVTGASQELLLHAPALSRALSPGQPVLIKTGWDLQPYLRRTFYPIAIGEGEFIIRIPPGGDWGHAWLQSAPLGTKLDCLGPVGRGFWLPEAGRNLLCIGEGDFAWPLLPAIQQASESGQAITLAIEALTARDLIPPARLPETVEYRVATLDGSRGHRGTLAASLQELLAWADTLLAAGSLAFYGTLAEAVRNVRFGLRHGYGQVLYPATILCGTGACGSCAADVAGGRRRVCLRGPVFDLAELVT